MGRGRWLGIGLALVGMAAYGAVVGPLQKLPRAKEADNLRVVVPGYIEVLLAGGDRHLAANIGVFRSMMVGGHVRDGVTYEVQAKIQQQVALMNPRQEDNYYIATAVLPWFGQVERTQSILDQATRGRDWDYLPPFFQGFNAYYFNQEYDKAGQLIEIAASRAQGKNAEAMRDIAAKWYTKGDDPKAAIGIITALKEGSRDPGMQRRLQGRIDRLEALITLREAAQRYNAERDEPLQALSQLQQFGYLDAIPVDPFRAGFEVDGQGQVQVASRKSQ